MAITVKNTSTQRQKLRNTLLKNGYIPLPLASKGVFIKGWSRAEIDTEWLDQYTRIGRYPDTGLRCDDLVAFDIDVLDEDLADECEVFVEQAAGPTELCRVGKWPKRLLLYRLDHLDRSLIRSGRTGNYGGHMCELLTTHGRQFAAFGMHPSGAQYKWQGDSPADVALPDVPGIEAEKALEILDGLDELLEATGFEKIRNAHTRNSRGRNEWDLTPDTEVMVAGEVVKWGELAPTLTKEGEFGNLWRPEQGEWGDSDAVHFYLAHSSLEPCAHDFVNDCTHWEGLPWQELSELLPDPPDADDNQFVPAEIADMVSNCVLLKDKTIRRLDSPWRAYSLDGWRQSIKHLRVAHPNPPRSNPNKTIEFFELWIQDPDTLRADYAALRPDHPGESVVQLGRERVMNTYRRPDHVTGGEIETFAEFLKHLVPGEFERDLFIAWLGRKVAFPGERMHGMVMVTPAYGTGRGTLVQIMQRLFGMEYVNEVELADLIGQGGQSQYNAYLADSLIVTVGEALEERENMSKWAARHVAYERLKVVCDPVANRMHVRRKYGANSTEQIFASLFISSNHMDALAIEEGDRRLIVLDNCEVPLVNAPSNLYARIHAWKDNPANIGELAEWLPLFADDYDGAGEPPMTPAKERMIEAGQSDVGRLFEIFVDQCEGDIVTPAQWRQFAHGARMQYDLDLPSDPTRRENALTVVVQQKARRIDVLPKVGIKMQGRPVRPWVIRNFGEWIGCSDTDSIRHEILKNGEPGGSNVVQLPSKGKD